MTTACGSMFKICSRHSKPSCPLTAFVAGINTGTEIHIQQNHIRLECSHKVFDTRRLRGYFDLLHIRFEQHIQSKQNIFVIVDNQYFPFFFHTGKDTRNTNTLCVRSRTFFVQNRTELILSFFYILLSYNRLWIWHDI